MTTYVLGFYFSSDLQRVCLIRKNRGYAANVGKLNGLGGRVEEGESFAGAMSREFLEEAGVGVPPEDWRPFANFSWGHGQMHCFRAREPAWWANDEGRPGPRTMEDEEVLWVDVAELPNDLAESVRWLVPLALEARYTVIAVLAPAPLPGARFTRPGGYVYAPEGGEA